MGPSARFGYPLRGGFEALIKGSPRCCKATSNWDVAFMMSIWSDTWQPSACEGRHVHYRELVSTMPLPELIRLLGKQVPAVVQAAAAELRHASVRCINLGIGRAHLTDKHWIYYPGKTVFHRVFAQGNASPHCNPPGGFGLTCEITIHRPNRSRHRAAH